MTDAQTLRIPAIQVEQTPGRFLYSFAVDGKLIPSFAVVSRLHRTDGDLGGYQRPEVISHIAEIRDYLNSDRPMIPNAVVIAFDDRVTFESDSSSSNDDAYTRFGTLTIPIDPSASDETKPGFIVDGQQRLAAIREAIIAHFPICVTSFIAAQVQEQVEQFILVNSTKPLPKGLIYELLPTTAAWLPSRLRRRRFPALLLDRLNRDIDSPLQGLIQTPTTPQGVIKDNSILKMLENSLSDGLLYRFRDPKSEGGRTEEMLVLLKAFWASVAETFADAWALPPRRSRLMHGAGIVSLGFLMDAIADRHRASGLPTKIQFLADLTPLIPVCRWVDGYWDFGPGQQRKWNEVQNTAKDVQLLTNYLILQYKSLVWNETLTYSRSPKPVPAPQNQLLLPT